MTWRDVSLRNGVELAAYEAHNLLGYMRLGCPQERMNREEEARRNVDLAASSFYLYYRDNSTTVCLVSIYTTVHPLRFLSVADHCYRYNRYCR